MSRVMWKTVPDAGVGNRKSPLADGGEVERRYCKLVGEVDRSLCMEVCPLVFLLVFLTLSLHQFAFFSLAFIFSLSPLTALFFILSHTDSQLTNHLLRFSFFLSLFLISYFSLLAPYVELNWQFSVSFQAHVNG